MTTMKTTQLGSALIAQGYLTQEKLNGAISEQKRSGRILGQILVDNRYVTEDQLAKTIAAQQNIPFIDLRHYDVIPEKVRILNEARARQFHALILEDRGDSYLVGLVDPTNLRAQDDLSHWLGRPIYISIITNEQFNTVADQIYRKTEQIDEYADEIKRDLESRIVDLNRLNESTTILKRR
jgi:MSHA biogenesis protein MshE